MRCDEDQPLWTKSWKINTGIQLENYAGDSHGNCTLELSLLKFIYLRSFKQVPFLIY